MSAIRTRMITKVQDFGPANGGAGLHRGRRSTSSPAPVEVSRAEAAFAARVASRGSSAGLDLGSGGANDVNQMVVVDINGLDREAAGSQVDARVGDTVRATDCRRGETTSPRSAGRRFPEAGGLLAEHRRSRRLASRRHVRGRSLRPRLHPRP